MVYKNTTIQKYTGRWNSEKRTNGGRGFRYWAEVESKKGKKYWLEVEYHRLCDPYWLESLHKEGDWAVVDLNRWVIVDMRLNR